MSIFLKKGPDHADLGRYFNRLGFDEQPYGIEPVPLYRATLDPAGLIGARYLHQHVGKILSNQAFCIGRHDVTIENRWGKQKPELVQSAREYAIPTIGITNHYQYASHGPHVAGNIIEGTEVYGGDDDHWFALVTIACNHKYFGYLPVSSASWISSCRPNIGMS